MELEHGSYVIHVKGNIIIVKLKGSFNSSGAKAWANKLRKVVESLNGKEFYMLSNELEFLGGTPDAYEEGNKYNEWLNSQNLIAKAIVTKSRTQKKIQISRIPSRSRQHIEYFNNEEEAFNWLEKQSSRDLPNN